MHSVHNPEYRLGYVNMHVVLLLRGEVFLGGVLFLQMGNIVPIGLKYTPLGSFGPSILAIMLSRLYVLVYVTP